MGNRQLEILMAFSLHRSEKFKLAVALTQQLRPLQIPVQHQLLTVVWPE